MTKTYNDIEAVTRLLEEKEKDVELTARLGKTLLDNNQKLKSTVATLELELKQANEKITQLSHELLQKSELIQILTNDVDDISDPSTPTGPINLDILQRRIGKLEEENVGLRDEACMLATKTEEVEQHEQKLVNEVANQLNMTRDDLSRCSKEADKYREESHVYRQMYENLAEKMATSEEKANEAKATIEELRVKLAIALGTQNELATELSDFKERYAEVLGLLQETQEALKKQKKKSSVGVNSGSLFPSLHTAVPLANNRDSLGTELECSLLSELSVDSGISADRAPHYRKVFETVQTASRSRSLGSSICSSNQSLLGSSLTQSVLDSASVASLGSYDNSSRGTKGSTTCSSQRYSYMSEDYFASDSDCSEDSSAYPGKPRDGIPGIPGSADLAEALRRLTPSEVYARRAALNHEMYSSNCFMESECRTPDSIMSTGSSTAFFGSHRWKIPDKLQIVKPIEGSQTLQHWSQLATPTLGGLLDERPGIKTRGTLDLEDLGFNTYSLTDVEEDEPVVLPGKQFQQSGHVYTYTNSTVLHPDDGTSLTSSICSSRMSTVSNSRASTAATTPFRSRRNSTCTFSVTLGLAKLLNERGIRAASPSTFGSPTFTPTATPCNSPERKSLCSTPDTEYNPTSLGYTAYLVSSGADYLRRTLSGDKETEKADGKGWKGDSDTKKKELSEIRLVETVEKLGVQSLISTPLSVVEEGNESEASSKCGSSSSKHTSESISSDLEKYLKRLPSSRSRQYNSNARVRSDLGTVVGAPPITKESSQSQSSSTLGTLSSLLFGRKGGLL